MDIYKSNPDMFTEEYIHKHADSIDWIEVSTIAPVEVIANLAEDFIDDLNWFSLSYRRNMPEVFIRKYASRINWEYLSQNNNIMTFSEQFFVDFKNKLRWSSISRLSWNESFMFKFHNNFHISDWNTISFAVGNRENYSDYFFEFFSHRLCWQMISLQKLSIEFIRKYKHNVRLNLVKSQKHRPLEEVVEIEEMITEKYIRYIKTLMEMPYLSSYNHEHIKCKL